MRKATFYHPKDDLLLSERPPFAQSILFYSQLTGYQSVSSTYLYYVHSASKPARTNYVLHSATVD